MSPMYYLYTGIGEGTVVIRTILFVVAGLYPIRVKGDTLESLHYFFICLGA
jgi:hypothetical protein